jgi:hypothetical protein
MDSPDSGLARLNSRISSILPAMTWATHHSPNHAAAGPIACYPSWDKSAIVRLSSICHTCVAHQWVRLFIFYCYG